MTFLLFTMGIICGLLFACFTAILLQRFQLPIQRSMTQFQVEAEHLLGKQQAYISGLSEEESSFMASLKDKEAPIV